MDQSSQIKATGDTYATLRLIVYAVCFIWIGHDRTKPDDAQVDLITSVLLPLAPIAAAYIQGLIAHHRRTDKAALKIDTGAILAQVTNSQLNAVVSRVQLIKADSPDISLKTAVSSAAQGVTK